MTSAARGRPQASSRETLAEAAAELFLEQGYEATTVADITRRAGVSRSSFFNYFDGKAATIWYALDERLRSGAGADPEHPAPDELLHTLALAIVNADAMGIADELALGRAQRQAALAQSFVKECLEALTGSTRLPRHVAQQRAEIHAAARAAAYFSAIWRWAEHGAGSERLSAEIADALALVPAFDGGSEALRVAVIGAGAIGSRVIAELTQARVPGAQLAGVITRATSAEFASLIERSDLVVECAGISAAREYALPVLESGRALLLTSIGVLADPEFRAQLAAAPGSLRLTSGAIGGLDLLTAAARSDGIPDGITRARITSTKRAASLVQPWMTATELERLSSASEPFELFTGNVTEAVEKFPSSLNVACALAHATGFWDETVVRLIADPQAARTTHDIEASGAAGDYRFTVTNSVSPDNPRSSAVVAEAVLRGIQAAARPDGTFL